MKKPKPKANVVDVDLADKTRYGHATFDPAKRIGNVTLVSDNGDSDMLTKLTRDDAVAIIAAMRIAFDIPDREAELISLLDDQSDRSMDVLERAVLAGIANVMYENGLRQATITPQNVIAGFTPSVSIDVTHPGVVTYTLNGEPLNAKDPA